MEAFYQRTTSGEYRSIVAAIFMEHQIAISTQSKGCHAKTTAWKGACCSNLPYFAGVLLNAFGLGFPGTGETGTPNAALNSYGTLEAAGYGDGSSDDTDIRGFINIILFDKNDNLLDVAFAQVTTSTSWNYLSAGLKVKEAGYAFVYVSHEDEDYADVYFDEVTQTYVPSRIVQSNEYYPFGLQTANSWTRAGATGNQFMYNEGSELNATTGLYDLPYRNYDAATGRFFQVDPMAHVSHTMTPYHFAGNNPIGNNDPSGAILKPIPQMAAAAPQFPDYASNSYSLWASLEGPGAPDLGVGGIEGSITFTDPESIAAVLGAAANGLTPNQIYNTVVQFLGVTPYGPVVYSPWMDNPRGGFGGLVSAYEVRDCHCSQMASYVALAQRAIDMWNASQGVPNKQGWNFNIGAEASSSLGVINMGLQLKPWLGFVYQSQAKVLTKVSSSLVYAGQRLNPNTTTYVSTAGLSVLVASANLSATIEYDQNGNVVGETQSYGAGALGLGIQLNFDSQGFKDFRVGLDDGVTLGAGLVGSFNFQMGFIYVDH